MSAQALQISTYASTNSINRPVDAAISYSYQSYNDIRTLSTTSASSGSNRVGFLYVPRLDAADCQNASAPFVPDNVTRIDDLAPSQPYQLIAMAPWISPACTLSYLQRATNDRLVNAFIFFLPDSNATSTNLPPLANDAAWGLGDGGQWKKQNQYPVYAIAASTAMAMLEHSAQYSGNTSSAPHGPDLVAMYGPESHVKLFVTVDLGSRSSGIPSIWIFLLIILAILLGAVGCVSLVMHTIQRRRRVALQRRIAEGQIDLEALGIRKLTVPQDIIDKMPVYPYASSAPAPSDTTAPMTDSVKHSSHSDGPHVSPPANGPLYQPTCAICLDDFVPQETSVRELPCRHIFHPACCDTFLRENSSLCPLCKRSTLPKGYCPPNISNVMVRRERNARRQRRHSTVLSPTNTRASVNAETAQGIPMDFSTMSNESMSPPPASAPNRREWARRRALAMLGPRAPPPDDTDTNVQTGSRLRKLLRTLFPGIG